MLRTLCCQRSSLFYLVLCAIYILYLMLGTVLLSVIEGGVSEQKAMDRYLETRKHFVELYQIDDKKLDEFLGEVLKMKSNGANVFSSGPRESSWSMSKSFMFATTLITTVGYGQSSPTTNAGKSCCIVYAMIGIPMTILLFSATVERLFYLSYKFIKNFIGIRYGLNEDKVRLTLFFSILILVIVFIFVIPTVVFTSIEHPEWSWLDSLYYCFISVTTIGLGDFVPGENLHGKTGTAYKIAVTIYILIGALSMLFLVTVTSTVPYFKLGRCYHLNYENEPDDCRQLIINTVGSVPAFVRNMDRKNDNIESPSNTVSNEMN